jgi:hypothetical protein
LMHTKGYAAPETKASLDQARLDIEQAEALGERPEDSLLLSVLYGFWVANWRSTATLRASLRFSSWRSQRSKGGKSRL